MHKTGCRWISSRAAGTQLSAPAISLGERARVQPEIRGRAQLNRKWFQFSPLGSALEAGSRGRRTGRAHQFSRARLGEPPTDRSAVLAPSAWLLVAPRRPIILQPRDDFGFLFISASPRQTDPRTMGAGAHDLLRGTRMAAAVGRRRGRPNQSILLIGLASLGRCQGAPFVPVAGRAGGARIAPGAVCVWGGAATL